MYHRSIRWVKTKTFGATCPEININFSYSHGLLTSLKFTNPRLCSSNHNRCGASFWGNQMKVVIDGQGSGMNQRKKKNRWTTSKQTCREQTFRTTWMKSLVFCGPRPCSWRVQASKEEAWATISTLFPKESGNPGRMQRQQCANPWACKRTKSKFT